MRTENHTHEYFINTLIHNNKSNTINMLIHSHRDAAEDTHLKNHNRKICENGNEYV